MVRILNQALPTATMGILITTMAAVRLVLRKLAGFALGDLQVHVTPAEINEAMAKHLALIQLLTVTTAIQVAGMDAARLVQLRLSGSAQEEQQPLLVRDLTFEEMALRSVEELHTEMMATQPIMMAAAQHEQRRQDGHAPEAHLLLEIYAVTHVEME